MSLFNVCNDHHHHGYHTPADTPNGGLDGWGLADAVMSLTPCMFYVFSSFFVLFYIWNYTLVGNNEPEKKRPRRRTRSLGP